MTAKEYQEMLSNKKVNTDYYLHGKQPAKEKQPLNMYSEEFVINFANYVNQSMRIKTGVVIDFIQIGIKELREFENINKSKMQ